MKKLAWLNAKGVSRITTNPEVLQPFRESMAQEVNRALQFFFSSSQVGAVDHVVVAGRLRVD